MITIKVGDITFFEGDVVVNAANNVGLGGGGVDGAIHRAAGPQLLEACKQLPIHVIEGTGPDRVPTKEIRIPTGGAVPTPAFNMPAKWIIHTVGPMWPADEDETARARNKDFPFEETTKGVQARNELSNCYEWPLLVATGMGMRSIAFPAISTGVYGCPVETCAETALGLIHLYKAWGIDGGIDVTIYLYPASHLATWKEVAERLNIPVTIDLD